jgi:hypothetical protein
LFDFVRVYSMLFEFAFGQRALVEMPRGREVFVFELRVAEIDQRAHVDVNFPGSS